jgi:hypothetical protein
VGIGIVLTTGPCRRTWLGKTLIGNGRRIS